MADEDEPNYDYTRRIKKFIFTVGIIILIGLVALYMIYKIFRCCMSSKYGQFRRVSTSAGTDDTHGTAQTTSSRVNSTGSGNSTTLMKPKEPGYYYYNGGNSLIKCQEVPRAQQELPPVLIPEVSYEYANSSAPPMQYNYGKY